MEITEEEKRAIKAYQGIGYRLINNILEIDMSVEESFIKNSYIKKPETFSAEEIRIMISNVPLIYSAMIKYSKTNDKKVGHIYRGTTRSDVERMRQNQASNKFLSTTYDSKMASGYFSLNWQDPAVVNIAVDDDVPFINMADALDDYGGNWESEVILSPFLQVNNISHVRSDRKTVLEGYKTQEVYSMEVRRQEELIELPEEEKGRLFDDVIENAEAISKKQERYFKVIEELEDNKYQIERNNTNISITRGKLYRGGLSDKEFQDLSEDLKFFARDQVKTLEDERKRLEQEKVDLRKEVEDWKRDVTRLCMSECRTVEKNIDKQIEDEKVQKAQQEEQERLDKKRDELKSIMQTRSFATNTVRATTGQMDKSAKKLISLREYFNREAKNMNISYTSYLDILHQFPQVISNLNQKLENFSYDKEEPSLGSEEEIEQAISEKQGMKSASNRLLNICGALKRIDVETLKGLEEQAFKEGIFNEVQRIKLDIFSGVLQSESEKLSNVKGIKKIINKLTGQQKKNEQKVVKLRHTMRSIYDKKCALAILNNSNNNYSIHEIMAEIEELKGEYGDIPEMANEIARLEEIKNGMKSMYRVNDDRVKAIIKRKAQQRLPISKGKELDKADIVMLQINELGNNVPPVRTDGRSFSSQSNVPGAVADCYEILDSIQIMSNIMRDVELSKEKTQLKGVDR